MQRTRIVSVSAAALITASTCLALAASPQEFIKDAIQGDNSEIMLGQLARQKGGNEEVRNFGQMLVSDHSTAKQEASAVAKTLGVTPPSDPMQEARDEQAKLSKMSGNDFDHEFASYMVTDHIKDIAAFQAESKADKGPAGELAAKQLPVLQKHLDMAQSIETAGAGSKSSASGSAPPITSFLTEEGPDLWRASKLPGVAIFGPDNRKVGTISDVLTGRDGKAAYIVVGVGGFLGLGQKDVAIPFDQVKFTMDPVTAPAGTAPALDAQSSPIAGSPKAGTPLGSAATSGAATGDAMAPASVVGLGTPLAATADPNVPMANGAGALPNGARNDAARSTSYPDHGVIGLTKDQLKAAPTFQFAK